MPGWNGYYRPNSLDCYSESLSDGVVFCISRPTSKPIPMNVIICSSHCANIALSKLSFGRVYSKARIGDDGLVNVCIPMGVAAENLSSNIQGYSLSIHFARLEPICSSFLYRQWSQYDKLLHTDAITANSGFPQILTMSHGQRTSGTYMNQWNPLHADITL